MLIIKGKTDHFLTVILRSAYQNKTKDVPISETSLQHVKSTKDWYSGHRKKCYKSVRKRRHNRKVSKRSDTLFQRKKIQMANEHIKK